MPVGTAGLMSHETSSKREVLIASLLLFCFLGGTALSLFSRREYWPFCTYPMFRELSSEPNFQLYRVVGVDAAGKRDVLSGKGDLGNILPSRLQGMLRTSVWLDLRKRGFDPKLIGRQGKKLTSGADTELTTAIRLSGWKLRYEPTMRLTHIVPAARLTVGYARRLYRGFGRASIWLDAYFRVDRCDSSKWQRFKRQ